MQDQLDLHPDVSAKMLESLYGALVGASQSVMTRLPEVHDEIDRGFLLGQAYGISAVMNHIVDRLVDRYGQSNLYALDVLSDAIHEEIVDQSQPLLMSLALKDAKGQDL